MPDFLDILLLNVFSSLKIAFKWFNHFCGNFPPKSKLNPRDVNKLIVMFIFGWLVLFNSLLLLGQAFSPITSHCAQLVKGFGFPKVDILVINHYNHESDVMKPEI